MYTVNDDQDQPVNVKVKIYNPLQFAGWKEIKEEIESGEKQYRIIAVGGDGTVSQIVEECDKNKIDFDMAPFGTIPTGTGNDFSRTIGWGSLPQKGLLDNGHAKIKEYIRYWIKPKPEKPNFDTWFCEIEVDAEKGSFQ